MKPRWTIRDDHGVESIIKRVEIFTAPARVRTVMQNTPWHGPYDEQPVLTLIRVCFPPLVMLSRHSVFKEPPSRWNELIVGDKEDYVINELNVYCSAQEAESLDTPVFPLKFPHVDYYDGGVCFSDEVHELMNEGKMTPVEAFWNTSVEDDFRVPDLMVFEPPLNDDDSSIRIPRPIKEWVDYCLGNKWVVLGDGEHRHDQVVAEGQHGADR